MSAASPITDEPRQKRGGRMSEHESNIDPE